MRLELAEEPRVERSGALRCRLRLVVLEAETGAITVVKEQDTLLIPGSPTGKLSTYRTIHLGIAEWASQLHHEEVVRLMPSDLLPLGLWYRPDARESPGDVARLLSDTNALSLATARYRHDSLFGELDPLPEDLAEFVMRHWLISDSYVDLYSAAVEIAEHEDLSALAPYFRAYIQKSEADEFHLSDLLASQLPILKRLPKGDRIEIFALAANLHDGWITDVLEGDVEARGELRELARHGLSTVASGAQKLLAQLEQLS